MLMQQNPYHVCLLFSFLVYSAPYTESILTESSLMCSTSHILGKSDDSWALQVVEPAEKIIRSFLNENASSMPDLEAPNNTGPKLIQRDLWTQYICQVSIL